MELKKYQRSAIEIINRYLKELKVVGTKYAFMGIADKPYNSDFFGEIPFICVKIPTGGGKTLVACHATQEIMKNALSNKMERGIVLWFTPSEAIKSQTLKKFKDKNDSHRRSLDEAFQGGLRIFSNEEALRIRREDVEDNLCIIISSLEAFRKDKKIQAKYKVYQENGSLLNHFEKLSNCDEFEKDEGGTIINSLANVVKMSNPLVVIDEGHKTQTKLSIDFIKDLNPCFVIEYTATPRGGSNILIDISASQLKAEQMVKIPIVLESATQWQSSISRGIEKRDVLEKEAKKIKNEYIRPIVLLQAQPQSKVSNNITVEQIKEYLLSAKISEEEIAIKTSNRNDLDGLDLLSKKCKIRYIITINALAEGWDCSFAYVLVSVANLGAKIAVEQIIGRIIRMPYARLKDNEDLNRCYIFASAKNFHEAATQIIGGLESNGYSRNDLLNSADKSQKYELEVERVFKKDFTVPMMCLDDEKLTFEDLIGENFELSKQSAQFDFDIHYDNDGRAIIDIQDDKWIKGTQQVLKLTFRDKNFSKNELVRWLDKKLRYTLLSQNDKVKFIDNALEHQLKNRSLSELSVNRYVLLSRFGEIINGILENYSKGQFHKAMLNKKIVVKTFDKYPEMITLTQEIPQAFNKNYYGKVEKLNKEELNFVERIDLDTLPNIYFWIRNREKTDPFYIIGWKKNKFYPDFVALTKNGNIIALEWKGEDRVSNEDTAYKTEIGSMWEKLGGGKLHFFLVHNGNIENVLNRLKEL